MNKGLVLAAFAVMLAGVFAISEAATATVVEEGRYTYSGTPVLDLTEGGNVTGVNLEGNDSTDKWAGYFGNVSGWLVLGLSESQIMYNWSWSASGGGEVCASQNIAFDWSSLADYTSALTMNGVFGWGAASDNATGTLTESGTLTIEGTAYTSNASTDNQGFQTVVLNEGAEALEDDYAFCVDIATTGTSGVTGANADYQLMVGTTPGADETYYFYLELY